MRQRLGLAAALLGDPRVLVLDEPANGLDPQGIRWLRDFLRRLASEGRAILVSSHVLAEVAQTADDVVVIHKGRSIVQSPLAELMARSGGGVRVAGPGRRAAEPSCCAPTASRSTTTGGAILVRDRTGEDIGRVIAANADRHLRAGAGQLVARGDLLRAHRQRGGRGPDMTRLIGSEVIKLRTTRTFYGVTLGAIGPSS